MPRVPAYQPNQVGPVETTRARFVAANNNGGFAGGLGEGLQTAGRGLANFAAAQDKLAEQNDDTQARLIAADAGKQYSLSTTEFEQLAGGQAREQQGAYNERLSTIQNDALSQATNPRMKRLVEERLAGLHAASETQIATHALKEAKVERTAAFGAQEASYAEQAAGTSDPEKRDQLIASGLAVVRDRLWENDGIDPKTNPEAYAVEALKYTSGVHAAVLDNMFSVPDPNVDEIAHYLTAYGDEMTDKLKNATMARLQTPLQDRMARSDADLVMGFVSPKEGEPANVAPVKPSGAPGSVAMVLSSAGLSAPVVAGFLGNFDVEGGYSGAKGDGGKASGIAQWHADRQANFRNVIGKPVSQATHAEQARFVVWEMNNPTAAGMTVAERDAIKNARTSEEAAALIDQHYERSSGQDRQARVAAAQRYGGGYANAPREWDRAAAEDALAKSAAANDWTPERTDRARKELEHRMDEDEGLLRDQRQAADEQVATIVAAKGDGFTSVSQIPSSVWAKLSPTDKLQWGKVAEANAKPKEAPANGPQAMALARMYIENPQQFATLNLTKYAPFLTPAELDTFNQEQARAAKAAASQTTTDPRPKIDATISQQKKWSGIDVDKHPDEGFRVRRYMEERAAEEAAPGKTFTQADYDRWFRDATRTATNKGYIYSSNERSSEFLSPNYRAVIVQQYRRNFGKDPSDKEIQDWWEKMGKPTG